MGGPHRLGQKMGKAAFLVACALFAQVSSLPTVHEDSPFPINWDNIKPKWVISKCKRRPILYLPTQVPNLHTMGPQGPDARGNAEKHRQHGTSNLREAARVQKGNLEHGWQMRHPRRHGQNCWRSGGNPSLLPMDGCPLCWRRVVLRWHPHLG